VGGAGRLVHRASPPDPSLPGNAERGADPLTAEKSGSSREGALGFWSMGRLTPVEIDVLDFERSWWKHAGAKEQAINHRFGLSATRYYQVLNELLEKPAAMVHDPILVKRLKRIRKYRQKQRVARLLGAQYTPDRG
jgi:hypothetical protein